jgi:2-desacetyl-2-hydroxyethyl bacteriochlorophyllide A dehydrogenase
MKATKIVFRKPYLADIKEFSVHQPNADEVQVKVSYSLISAGTEKAYFKGSPNTAQKFPATPGYSSAGVVKAVGKNVKTLQKGDRVFVANGGHASFNTVHKKNVFKVPDSVSLVDASFTRLASFPLLAIRGARLDIGESLVIVGLGMLGLFGVQIARLAGALPLVAIGNRELRRDKAKQFGADYVFDPKDAELTKKVIEATSINGVRGANVIIETSGTTNGLLHCLEYTSNHARVLLNGCNRVTEKPVDFYRHVHIKGVQLIGAHDHTRLPYNSAPGNWTATRDYITVLGFFADGRLNAKDMTSELVFPEKAREIYDRLIHDRQFPLGVLFDWTGY